MLFTGEGAINFTEPQKKWLTSLVDELIYAKLHAEIERRLPQMLDEALDRQKKTVGDELVRILLSKTIDK